MTNVVCFHGASPENLAEKVNEFLESLDVGQKMSVNIQFTHIHFEGTIDFYAYLTYWKD